MDEKHEFDKIAELISAQLGEKIANNDSTPIFYGVADQEGTEETDITENKE